MDALVTIRFRIKDMTDEETAQCKKEFKKIVKEVIEDEGLIGLLDFAALGVGAKYDIRKIEAVEPETEQEKQDNQLTFKDLPW